MTPPAWLVALDPNQDQLFRGNRKKGQEERQPLGGQIFGVSSEIHNE